MKKYILKSILIFTALTFVILQACEKKGLVEEYNITDKEKTEFPVVYYDNNNDMLVFATMNDMNKYVESINLGKPLYQIDDNFISLSAVYNRLIDLELSLENEYESLYKDKDLSEEQLKTIKNELDAKPLDEITKQYIENGIIKEVKENNNSRIELTTCAPYYASVLNSDNLVKVGDTIYKYTSDKVKMITDGDFNKIPLLKKISESDSNNNIEVVNVNTQDKSQIMFYKNSQIEAYKKKLIVTAFLNVYDYSGLKAYVYCEIFYCERKNWLGRWVSDDNAEVIIKDYLQVKKGGVTVLNHSSGVVVYHNYPCYSSSIFVYNDTNNYSSALRQFSYNPVLWTRSGGPSGFSAVRPCSSYQW